MKDLTRRQIRYICFRLQTEAEGSNKAAPEKTGIMNLVDEIKEHIEMQEDFEGWKMFAKSWDVDQNSPLVVVKRNSSIYTDWNNVLKKEAKSLPPAIVKKKVNKKVSPQRGPGGRFVSKKAKTETQVLLPPEPVISSPILEVISPPDVIPDKPSASEETTPPAKPEKKKFWEILK